MRQISSRQLRGNVAGELANLPFEVTKQGKVIAVCTLPRVLVGCVHIADLPEPANRKCPECGRVLQLYTLCECTVRPTSNLPKEAQEMNKR